MQSYPPNLVPLPTLPNLVLLGFCLLLLGTCFVSTCDLDLDFIFHVVNNDTMGNGHNDDRDGRCYADDYGHDELVYSRHRPHHGDADARRSSHHTLYSNSTSTSSVRSSSPPSSRRGSLITQHAHHSPHDRGVLPPPVLRGTRSFVDDHRHALPLPAPPPRRGSTTSLVVDDLQRNHNHTAHQHHGVFKRLASHTHTSETCPVPRDYAHPYCAQPSNLKRHSFAAFRSTSATPARQQQPLPGDAAGHMHSPPLPIVRLPSIDHGLPPFDAAEHHQMMMNHHPAMVRVCRLVSLGQHVLAHVLLHADF